MSHRSVARGYHYCASGVKVRMKGKGGVTPLSIWKPARRGQICLLKIQAILVRRMILPERFVENAILNREYGLTVML